MFDIVRINRFIFISKHTVQTTDKRDRNDFTLHHAIIYKYDKVMTCLMHFSVLINKVM